MKFQHVHIGNTTLGEGQPVVVQSMTNTDTADVEATVAQCKRMITAGAEMVRITVPSMKEVESLRQIKEQLRAEGIKYLRKNASFVPHSSALPRVSGHTNTPLRSSHPYAWHPDQPYPS